jgi:hypothetical protein
VPNFDFRDRNLPRTLKNPRLNLLDSALPSFQHYGNYETPYFALTPHGFRLAQSTTEDFVRGRYFCQYYDARVSSLGG